MKRSKFLKLLCLSIPAAFIPGCVEKKKPKNKYGNVKFESASDIEWVSKEGLQYAETSARYRKLQDGSLQLVDISFVPLPKGHSGNCMVTPIDFSELRIN